MTTTVPDGAPSTSIPAGVLRTRLLPPRLPPNSVPRPELVARANRGLEGRLLAIVAGAGYGKTTLLVQALEGSPLPWVWVSCDPRLRTPEMLLAHVAAGVAGAFPGVATALPPGGSPDDQMAALANEIVVTIPDDFVLALDDVHALDPGPVRDTLGRLASDLPPNVHLAMTGRRDLSMPTSRAAAGGTTVIDEGMLAFSFSEAAELLEDAPGELLETEIGELHQRTEGWVSGLLLATRSGGDAVRAAHVSTAGPHFDYLADEVLAGLPEELQRFLLDTSVLERFTPPLAAAVAERADAREVLRDLVASHLFIVQAEGDWYRYHHLFGAFLRRRLAEREPARLVELHGRAARAWEAAGDNQEAVRHFLAAGAIGEAARALEPVAESMVPTPERQTLAGWLQRIPPEEWRPRLQLAGALLTYLGGDARAAFEAWDEAIDRLMEAGEVERAAGALYRSQLAMLTVGVSPAVRVALAERHLPRLDDAGPAAGLARMIVAVAYAIGGRRAEAEELIGAALASARPARAGAAGSLRRDGARLLLRLRRRAPGRGAAAPRGRPQPPGADRGGGVVHAPGLRPGQPRPDPGRHGPLRGLPARGAIRARPLGLARHAVGALAADPVVAAAVAVRAGRLGGGLGARARGAPGDRAPGRAPTRPTAWAPSSRARRPRAARSSRPSRASPPRGRRCGTTATPTRSPWCWGSSPWRRTPPGRTALGRELAEEAVATAERLRLDWFRARGGAAVGERSTSRPRSGTPGWRRRWSSPSASAWASSGAGGSGRARGRCWPARCRPACPEPRGRAPRRRVRPRGPARVRRAARRTPPPGRGWPTRWATTPTWTPRPSGC